MSGRGPEPKELRASLVDSGWSVTPPPVEEVEARTAVTELTPRDPASRRLPNYEDLSQAPVVTQVDNEIQDRLRAMQRASLVDQPRPASGLPPPPPSRPSRPAAPSLPPPPPPSMPPPRPSSVPLPSFDARAQAQRPSFRPPSAQAPLPSYAAASDTSEFVSADPIEVDEDEADVPLPSFEAPSSRDRAPSPFSTAPAAPFSAAPAAPFSVAPAAPFSVAPAAPFSVAPAAPFSVAPPAPASATPLPSYSMAPVAPSLRRAVTQRVRFAGGEVPLWSLLAPMILLLALGSAFAAAALGSSHEASAAPLGSASSVANLPSASALASAAEAPEPAPAPTAAAMQAPALPTSSIDTEALEARRAEELTKSEALALATARREREVARAALLRQKLSRDPGLFQDAATLAELRRAAEDPLTAPDALGALAEAPGSLSADLLYEMWTGTVMRNSATELARSLVFSKEVRAKASPELAVALDLRIAETCEQNKALLPRVLEKGDRRSLALLARLSRKFGCGPNKRLDCYPCLRDSQIVDEAMVAVKKRREPKPFAGK